VSRGVPRHPGVPGLSRIRLSWLTCCPGVPSSHGRRSPRLSGCRRGPAVLAAEASAALSSLCVAACSGVWPCPAACGGVRRCLARSQGHQREDISLPEGFLHLLVPNVDVVKIVFAIMHDLCLLSWQKWFQRPLGQTGCPLSRTAETGARQELAAGASGHLRAPLGTSGLLGAPPGTSGHPRAPRGNRAAAAGLLRGTSGVSSRYLPGCVHGLLYGGGREPRGRSAPVDRCWFEEAGLARLFFVFAPSFCRLRGLAVPGRANQT
jgi:hypothetical protein